LYCALAEYFKSYQYIYDINQTKDYRPTVYILYKESTSSCFLSKLLKIALCSNKHYVLLKSKLIFFPKDLKDLATLILMC